LETPTKRAGNGLIRNLLVQDYNRNSGFTRCFDSRDNPSTEAGSTMIAAIPCGDSGFYLVDLFGMDPCRPSYTVSLSHPVHPPWSAPLVDISMVKGIRHMAH
jgi:hypothetical protein